MSAKRTKYDQSEVELSNVVGETASVAYLFNGAMPDRTSPIQNFESHLHDENPTSAIVLATTSINDHGLPKRLFPVNHVSSAESLKSSCMSSIKSTKTNLSNAVAMARPFDEFVTGVTMVSADPFDGQSLTTSTTTKSDKD